MQIHVAASTGLRSVGAMALAGLVLVGCAAPASTAPGTSVAATPSPVASPVAASASAAISPQVTASASTPAAADATAWTCTPLGALEPTYTVTAPAGWTGYGGECGFMVPIGDGFSAGLSAWIVGEVPADPCQNRASRIRPGTVNEIVSALMAQKGRTPTDPVDISLAGYDGRYLEWSVPTDVEFTGGDQFYAVDCDEQNYLSWTGRTGGTRYQQVGGQVDRLWVLDVDGQPVIVDASYGPDASDRVKAELAAMVETLRFLP